MSSVCEDVQEASIFPVYPVDPPSANKLSEAKEKVRIISGRYFGYEHFLSSDWSGCGDFGTRAAHARGDPNFSLGWLPNGMIWPTATDRVAGANSATCLLACRYVG